MSKSTSIIGRWRITEMDNWDQEAVDLVQPGFIEFDDDGLGSLGFIVVTGELDCCDADRDGRPGVEFSWQGSDEGDDVSGRGWAALNPSVARSMVLVDAQTGAEAEPVLVDRATGRRVDGPDFVFTAGPAASRPFQDRYAAHPKPPEP